MAEKINNKKSKIKKERKYVEPKMKFNAGTQKYEPDLEKKDKDSVAQENSSKSKKKNERAIRNFLIVLGVIIVILVACYFLFFSMRYGKYDYNNVTFQTVQQGKLTFYQFSIPVIYQGKLVPYNFYIRTNPRVLKNVPFNNLNNYVLMKHLVIVVKDNFTNCNGDQIIAMANLAKLYTFLGVNLNLQYGNSTLCDLSGNTQYINIQESNETRIYQVGFSCFRVDVNKCEILKATEKLMVESVVKYNQM